MYLIEIYCNSYYSKLLLLLILAIHLISMDHFVRNTKKYRFKTRILETNKQCPRRVKAYKCNILFGISCMVKVTKSCVGIANTLHEVWSVLENDRRIIRCRQTIRKTRQTKAGDTHRLGTGKCTCLQQTHDSDFRLHKPICTLFILLAIAYIIIHLVICTEYRLIYNYMWGRGAVQPPKKLRKCSK